MIAETGPDWTNELLAAAQVVDLARDPDDFRVTRQSKVTIGGLLVPVSDLDGAGLDFLFGLYAGTYNYYRRGGTDPRGYGGITATMEAMMKRSAARFKGVPPDFSYISIDPRDYTTFSAPDIGDLTVISIHTRPERCWFLGILKFESALGLSLGRMRVMRPTDKGLYPVTIRSNWRALTNKVKQEEVRDAYRRLIQASS